jgi:hypothetical protein
MKFAVLFMYELRSAYKCIGKLTSKLVNFYNADVFVLCQRHFDDDDSRLSLFNTNLKHAELYDKPDPLQYFGENSNITIDSHGNNWNNLGNSQTYINNHKFSKVISAIVNDYDYYITVRIDSEILFDFPSIECFKNITPGIHAYSCPDFDKFGGTGFANFIHKNFIIEYLTASYDIITDKSWRSKLEDLTQTTNFNQERLCQYALSRKGLAVRRINGLNYFYTTDDANSYTTWGKPTFHETYKVFYKYISQVNYAFDCYKAWLRGGRWITENEHIRLSSPKTVLNLSSKLLSKVYR